MKIRTVLFSAAMLAVGASAFAQSGLEGHSLKPATTVVSSKPDSFAASHANTTYSSGLVLKRVAMHKAGKAKNKKPAVKKTMAHKKKHSTSGSQPAA